jgi:hypothetical protein
MPPRIVTIVVLFVAGAANVFGQDIAPPPGFVPGQSVDVAPTPPPLPGILPAQNFNSDQNNSSRQSYIPAEGEFYPEPGTPYQPYQPPPRAILLSPDVMPMPRLWLRAEALYWWTKASPLPVPIVTQGSAADTIPGALGQPGTSVLIGDQAVSFDGRGGGRFTLGFTLDAPQVWALEGSYFFLASSSVSQQVSSDGGRGSPLLAIPFFDPTLPGESATFLSDPGFFAGNGLLTITDFLQGLDLNLVYNLQSANGIRVDLLGGFRWVNLQENLSFVTDSPGVPPGPPDFFQTFDRFNANNNFYGGQLGLRASYDNSRLFFNATGKLALGGTVENVFVNGGTFTSIGSAPGAYFTQPTNMGSFSQSQFAVVPEVNLNFGVRLSPWASIVVGYSFLYISSVARPGDQIDRVINPTQAPAITGTFPGSLSGPARPALNIHDTDFWAQGLNFALELRY